MNRTNQGVTEGRCKLGAALCLLPARMAPLAFKFDGRTGLLFLFTVGMAPCFF
jgi:hypothetical protein